MSNANDIAKIVSVQPLVSEIGKVFFMKGSPVDPSLPADTTIGNVRVEILSKEVRLDKVGGEVQIWHDVLSALDAIPECSNESPRVNGKVDFFNTIQYMSNVVSSAGLRGDPSFLILNDAGVKKMDDVLCGENIPSTTLGLGGCSHDHPCKIGSIDNLDVYYDETIKGQIMGYNGNGIDGSVIDTGLIVSTLGDKYDVKLVNPNLYARFNF